MVTGEGAPERPRDDGPVEPTPGLVDEAGAARGDERAPLADEAGGLVERLEDVLAIGSQEADAEAARLAAALADVATALGAPPLADLARSMRGTLREGRGGGADGRRALLAAVDAARGLVDARPEGPRDARAAAAALDRALDRPAAPTLPWARRALLERLAAGQAALLLAVEAQVAETGRGRDRGRARAALARELEVTAAAYGLVGHGAWSALGLGLAAFLAERTPAPAARRAARAAVALATRPPQGAPGVDVPAPDDALEAVAALRATLAAPPEGERAAVALELPWPDVDRPSDFLQTLERLLAGRAVLDARPGASTALALVGTVGLAPPRAGRRDDEGVVRVPRRRLDRLVGLAEELVEAKARATALASLAARAAQAAGAAGGVDAARVARQAADLERDLDDLARRTQEAALRARLVAARGLLATARVTAREQLARRPDVAVRLELDGAATEIDKAVVDALVEPVLHLVTNAIAHGVEPRAARAAAGKPEEAALRVSVRATPAGVTVEVEDDGRGLDESALLRGGEAQGYVVVRDASEEGLALRLAPTRGAAGPSRGAHGLARVLERVRALRGRLVLRNAPGRGALVRLVLPPAVSTARVLLVRCGAERYAIPLAAVAGVTAAADAPEGVPAVSLRALVGAPEVAEAPAEAPDGRRPQPVEDRAERRRAPRGVPRERRLRDAFCVLVAPEVVSERAQAPALACLVDDVLRRDLVVVRPIGRRFAPPGVDGVALHGDGRLVPVLDLLRLAQGR